MLESRGIYEFGVDFIGLALHTSHTAAKIFNPRRGEHICYTMDMSQLTVDLCHSRGVHKGDMYCNTVFIDADV